MIYVLYDNPLSYISKADNFNSAWMSFIQPYLDVKFAPFGMDEFKPNDTVIAYLDTKNPFDSYKLLPSMKRILIVGNLNRNNIDLLENVDFCIYTNELQQQIATLYGIKTKSCVIPSMPAPNLHIPTNKKNRLFIGGLMVQSKLEGFYSRILSLHEKYDVNIPFFIMGVDDDPQLKSYVDSLTAWLMDSSLNGTRIVHLEFNCTYNRMFQLHLAASSDIHLWKNEPLYDDVVKMVKLDDIDGLLNHSYSTSTQMPIAKKYNVKIDCEPTYSLHHSFSDGKFTMFDFALFMQDRIKQFGD